MEKSAQLPGLGGLRPIVQEITGSCLLVAFLGVNTELILFNIFINCLNNGTKHVLSQSTAHTELRERLALEGRATIHKDTQQATEHH